MTVSKAEWIHELANINIHVTAADYTVGELRNLYFQQTANLAPSINGFMNRIGQLQDERRMLRNSLLGVVVITVPLIAAAVLAAVKNTFSAPMGIPLNTGSDTFIAPRHNGNDLLKSSKDTSGSDKCNTTASIVTMVVENPETDRKLQKCSDKLKDCQTHNAQLDNNRDAVVQLLASTDKNLKDCTTQKAEIDANLAAAHRENARLQNELSDLSEKLVASDTQKVQIEGQLTQVNAQIGKLTEQLNQATTNLHDAQAANARIGNEITQMAVDKQQLQKQADQLTEKLNERETHNSQIGGELEQVKGKIETLNQELSQALDQLRNAQDDKVRIANELGQITLQKQQFEQRAEQLTTNLQHCESSKSQIADKIKEAEAEIERVKSIFVDQQTMNAKAVAELIDCKNDMDACIALLPEDSAP